MNNEVSFWAPHYRGGQEYGTATIIRASSGTINI